MSIWSYSTYVIIERFKTFVQENLTFVFSSTTLSPSAETHRTALTAFFPDFKKKEKKRKEKKTVLCQQHPTATRRFPFQRTITLSVGEVHSQYSAQSQILNPSCKTFREPSQSQYFRNSTSWGWGEGTGQVEAKIGCMSTDSKKIQDWPSGWRIPLKSQKTLIHKELHHR